MNYLNLKKKFIKFLKVFIYYSGLFFLINLLLRKKVIYIVLYHRIADVSDTHYNHHLSVRKDKLEEQVKFYKENYECISMSEAVEILSKGVKLEKNYLVISFDDGYYDNYKYGINFFKQNDLKPIIYLTADKIENREPIWTERFDFYICNSKCDHLNINIGEMDMKFNFNDFKNLLDIPQILNQELKKLPIDIIEHYMDDISIELGVADLKVNSELLNWEQVNNLIKDGFEVGSHTLHHINLTVESDEILENELKESKSLIEKRTNKKINSFAYPFGKKQHFNCKSVQYVKKYYTSAVSAIRGVNSYKGELYQLNRVAIGNTDTLIDIKVKFVFSKLQQRIFHNNIKRRS